MQACRSISAMLAKLASARDTAALSRDSSDISAAWTENSSHSSWVVTRVIPDMNHGPDFAIVTYPGDWVCQDELPVTLMDFENIAVLSMDVSNQILTDKTCWDLSNNIDWVEFDMTVQDLDMDGNRGGVSMSWKISSHSMWTR
ncbi:hypothetical protein BJX61DRAFT_344823 [Aspergillus egyptiacus]|nr:hypothetical protein BJX61DRAFT_344823 [Aspergillus egyptiacus]